MNNVITIENLSATYGTQIAIEGISCSVPEGVRCAIMGPNGAGKTTLLRTIVQLHRKKTGTVLFWQQPFMKVKDAIAYVAQHKSVDWGFPLNVFDAVSMGTRHSLLFLSSAAKERTVAALRTVNLLHYRDRQINELSGGEKQRVFIARAVAQAPKLFLMDEPFTGLDEQSEQIIAQLFFSEQAQGNTIVAVHHDWQTVHHYFDWIIFINKKIIYAGALTEAVFHEYGPKTFSSLLPTVKGEKGEW